MKIEFSNKVISKGDKKMPSHAWNNIENEYGSFLDPCCALEGV